MKTIILIVSAGLISLLTGCTSSSKLKENRVLLMEYAFCKCLQFASQDSLFFKNDVSIGVYRDIAQYYSDAFDVVDSFSKRTSNKIVPSIIHDHNGKKAILKDCFFFFKSKELDSLVKSLDNRSFKGW